MRKKIKNLSALLQEAHGYAISYSLGLNFPLKEAIPWRVVQMYLRELAELREENKKLKEQRDDHRVSHICERIL